jgi:hypothetical protein
MNDLNVVSLDAFRAARKPGQDITHLRAAAARARRQGDWDRMRFFQTLLVHRLACAQSRMPHATGPDGPPEAA